ncbi:MAG TPA: DUF2403 domain-containing protein, partial [Polyangia bacterium]
MRPGSILSVVVLAACSSTGRGAGTGVESGVSGNTSDVNDTGAIGPSDTDARLADGHSQSPDGPTDGASNVPASCPASAAGNTPLGSDTPPAASRWKVTDAITFLNVGGSGSYDRIVDMAPGAWPPPCSDPNACVKATKSVSGPLVPFDEEMTMVFSGPIELYDIAVYAPATSGFARVSHWDRCTSDNL